MERDTKWTRYLLLVGNEGIKDALPHTVPYSTKAFRSFLEKYGEVIVKREVGCRGYGMMKVTKKGEEQYILHYNRKRRTFGDLRLLIRQMEKRMQGRKYLVQEYIDLASVDGRPFDLRVMVQRKAGEPWRVTGSYAKLAQKGWFNTNLATGGIVLPTRKALLLAGLKEKAPEVILDEIEGLAIKIAKQLDEKFKRQTIWGMDMGLDKTGKVYLIEMNRAPGIKGFRKLNNPRVYTRIQSIIRHNRRKRKSA
ncbi:YheC/YheD family protein [Melghirimyces profundicolus]|nr:YheC/YheD family protein [Melghirimyces profundicolus]